MSDGVLYVGLMSGTSGDGVDAALVRLRDPDGANFEVMAFTTTVYSGDLRNEILAVADARTGSVDRVCRLDAVLGEWFARAAVDVINQAGLSPGDVCAIGSHGQTVHHLPDVCDMFEVRTRSTLQIGNAGVIAERTGIQTVSDFRSRDVAVGGQGAPLVPLIDYLLFKSDTIGRVLLNIGGIANVTVLPAGCGPGEVMAFDTGPGNVIIDGLVSRLFLGGDAYDEGGTIAASGSVNNEMLESLMRHPYFEQTPPRSTGREMFGGDYIDDLVTRYGGLVPKDIIATATAFTAQSIVESLRCYAPGYDTLGEMYVSGGGGENGTLMNEIGVRSAPMQVSLSNELGLDSDAKEAVAFAILAHRTLNGLPGNLPSATGADRSVVLGQITPGQGG
jgi:anhydro-N-acetylmuramic acid kinase